MTRKKKKDKRAKNLIKKIFNFLKENSNKPYNYKQISASLSLSDDKSRTLVLKKLSELKAEKKIIEVGRGKFQINKNRRYSVGVLDITSNGNGYFITDDYEEDIFVPNINLGKGLHSDIVKTYVYKKQRSKKLEAEVTEVVERSKTDFVGVFHKSKNFGFVVPNSGNMYIDIFVSQDNMGKAKHGDKVQVSIIDWPENSKSPFGKIKKVLGNPDDYNTEIHSILLEYNLPLKFSEEVENEADRLSEKISKKEAKKRRDMRNVLTLTIDPKDAKDLDDALSFKKLDNGNYEIGVHIADVSHYVKPKTTLDEEAYNRSTSVYLIDKVVPMLPKILSNNVCSLNPSEEKLTFSVVFEINEKAELVNKWFGKTIINSNYRFAYEEVQYVIENKNNIISETVSTTGKKYSLEKETTGAILKLDSLAKKLRKKRINQGAITFDKVEVKFHLDENKNPVNVYFKEVKDANNLIEEYMLLANRKVAEFVGLHNRKQSNRTFVYRVHDEPDTEKLILLQNIISKFGYKINIRTKETISESLNKLLKDVKGKSESNIIETLAIRSMSKAVYTTKNISHYGLAFDYYSHFTSPIRRYPDLVTHRLLQHYLEGGKTFEADLYEQKCKHFNDREELANKAERDSIKYMQIKLMENQTNRIFKGTITGITEWGIYIEIESNKCTGMVRIRTIKSDYYIFDEELHAIVGQWTENKYQIGDKVKVRVKKTDLIKKHLDFILIED